MGRVFRLAVDGLADQLVFDAGCDGGFASGTWRVLLQPPKPDSKNRLRQQAAFWLLTPRAAAISRSDLPSAARSTILARSTCRAGRDLERARSEEHTTEL